MSVLDAVFGEDAGVLGDGSFRLLVAANVIGTTGIAMLSPILDTLTGPVGVSSTEIGLLVSAYTAPSIVVIPLVGVLADRYGRKPLLVAGLVLFGLGGTLLAATTDFRVMLGLRLVQGVGGACVTPVIITSMGDLYEGTAETTAQGLRFSTSGLSQMAFPLVAGVLVTAAWYYPLLLYAIAFPIAALVAVRFEEPVDPLAEDGDRAASGQLRALARLASRPGVVAVVIARTVPSFVYFGFLTYASIVVVGLLDATPGEAGVVVGLASVAFAASSSQTGRATARVTSRLRLLVVLNLTIAIGLSAVGLAPSLPIVAAGAVVLGSGHGMLLSLCRSLVTGIPAAELRGGLVSVSEGVGRTGITVVPVVMGAAVTVATPILGFEAGVRWTVVGVGVGGGAVGVTAATVARATGALSESGR